MRERIIPEKMHAAASKAQSIEDLDVMIPGLAVLVDVSEQPIYRPQDDETQKEHYSGNAKRHTMKTQYATTHDGLLLRTSAVKGGKHDFAVFKETVPTFPENLPGGQETTLDKKCLKLIKFIADSAYAGTDKTVPQHRSHVSRKRKPGKKLTPAEKEYNKALAEIRIRVEHAIRRVKVFRVMGDRYRNPRKKYASINNIVCGLVNMMRLWERAAT